ncbi:MAG: bifunctional adenosylcobinamide kinase/adenosylcobinamide-phosphate guanylyltransferase [Eubacteriales bacterium]|nr:bifunctional adenosylcobinamide kinase/adenosylcobinamide-phosphate guanylyltransferase [Eubacteriales bacterium]
MILLIGGAGSGKWEYVKSLGYSDKDIANGVLDERKVLYNLQNIVFDNPDRAPELLDVLLDKEMVVCNEVGSGIVPLDARDRQARETTGRLCIQLAAHASRVVRMVCGIPVVIKE